MEGVRNQAGSSKGARSGVLTSVSTREKRRCAKSMLTQVSMPLFGFMGTKSTAGVIRWMTPAGGSYLSYR
jgi:hypothetical protein